MTIKKKRAGGLISRIRNNRRIRKQRKLARENAGSAARSATSKLNSSSATPSKPKASVASGFVRQTVAPKMAASAPQRLKTRSRRPNLGEATSTLRTMASRRPTLSRGSRNDETARSMGSGRGVLGMGEGTAIKSSKPASSTSRSGSSLGAKRTTSSPKGRTIFGTPAYRSIEDMKRAGLKRKKKR